jgi:hypothetical protein
MEPRPFVGRAEEFERLERALRRTQSAVGATVLVAGEAGIGKSRLAAELTTRARAAGFEVLVGRCIDLIGTELPYQPFADALRPWSARHGERALPWLSQVRPAGSQLRVFEETLALFSGLAVAAPVLLVLEDLHWADTSTLDLVVFLAQNLAERRLLLLATYRADELSSAERMRRLADGVRRSGAALELELGPLDREEVTALLAARRGAPPPRSLVDAIAARSEGNPFFAEELLAAAGGAGSELPRSLRQLLLQRVAQLDPARRTCSSWPPPQGARWTTACSATRPPWPSSPCASACAGPSITACSSPTRRPAASASGTPCWPRRSTRRCCPANARSSTGGSPPSSPEAARRRRRRSSHRIGKRRAGR